MTPFLEPGIVQSLMNTITNFIQFKKNGVQFCEQEYIYYNSCLKLVEANNVALVEVIQWSHKELKKMRKNGIKNGVKNGVKNIINNNNNEEQ
jgi:hypothetical protein